MELNAGLQTPSKMAQLHQRVQTLRRCVSGKQMCVCLCVGGGWGVFWDQSSGCFTPWLVLLDQPGVAPFAPWRMSSMEGQTAALSPLQKKKKLQFLTSFPTGKERQQRWE